jgi:ATP-binding cassette subfamily B protein
MLVALLDKPLSFHYGKKSQETADKISELLWLLDSMIAGLIFDFAPAIIAATAILAYLTYLDWRIALPLAVALISLIVYTYRTVTTSLKNQEDWRGAHRKLGSFGWDSLRNILVVKSTTNESMVAQTLKTYGEALFVETDKSETYDRRVLDMQNLIIGLGSVAVLLVAIVNFRSGTLTFGGLSAVTAYTFAIFGYVRYCQWVFRALLKTTAVYRDVVEVMKEPPEDMASGKMAALTGDVKFRNVRFRYREDKPALEDVSFTVRHGQRVAIVGESGEGKTTMVDLLGRYYIPQSGAVMFDGVDSREINLRSLRSQMAYVPQELTLFHENLGFNIRYGRPDAQEADLHAAARAAHLDEFIETLPEKYETVVGERGLKLSGGERQRVALARAFLRNPKILVLDEPTAHLDSRTEEAVRQSLEELMRGRTTFIIAHRLRTVMDADLILVLKDGMIVESGRHEELSKKADGAYSAFLKAQTGLIAPDERHIGQAPAA